MVDNYEGRFNVTQGDTSGIDAVSRLNKHLDDSNTKTERLSDTTNSLSEQYAKIRREKAPEELAKQFAELAAGTGNTRTALLLLNTELHKIDAANDEITKAARIFDKEYTGALKKAQVEAKKTEQATVKAVTSLNAELAKIAKGKQVDKLVADFAKTAAETGNVRTEVLKLNAELAKLDLAEADISRVAQSFDSEYTAAVKRAEAATEKLRKEQELQGKAGAALRGKSATLSTENVGDISTTLGSIGSVTGALGTNPLTEGLRLGGDAAGVLEYIPRFTDAVNNAGKAAQSAGGLMGGLANTGAAVAAALPGVSVGFGAVLAVAAPFAIALGALAIGFNKLQESAKGVNEANKAFFARQQAEAEFLNSDLTTEQAKKRKAELETTIAQQEQILANGDAALAQSFTEAQAQFGDFAARIGTAGLGLGGGFDAFNTGMTDAKDKLSDARGELAALNPLLEENAFLVNDNAQALEDAASRQASTVQQTVALFTKGFGAKELKTEIDQVTLAFNANAAAQKSLRDQGYEGTAAFQALKDEELALIATRTQLTSATSLQLAADNDLIAAQERQIQITQDIAKAVADFNRNEAAEAFNDSIAASDAAVDAQNRANDAKADLNRRLEQQEKQHQASLEAIAKRGNEQVAQLQKQLADKITANNQALTKVRQDYEKNEIKARADYLKRRNEIENNADKSALDARIENDATALARIRAQEEADLGELDTNEQERAAEAKAQLDERIATLQAETEAFKLEIAARILETQNQTTAAIAEAQKQYDARLKLDEEERQIKEQRAQRDADLAEQRRVRNEQLEQAAQDAALKASIAAITAKSDTELAGMLAINDAALLLEQTGIRLQSAFGGLFSGVSNPLTKALENAYNGGSDKPFTQSSGYDPYPDLPPIPTSPTPTSTPYSNTQLPNFAATQVPNMLPMGMGKEAVSAPPNVYITVESPTVGDVASLSMAKQVATEIADQIASKYQVATVQGVIKGNFKAANRRS